MAPELFYKKNSINLKNDIWSLGILFYKLIYKDHPFFDNSIINNRLKII